MLWGPACCCGANYIFIMNFVAKSSQSAHLSVQLYKFIFILTSTIRSCNPSPQKIKFATREARK